MKVTNTSGSIIYLDDLVHPRDSQSQGRRGEEIYLHPGQFTYLLNTSEVLRSAHTGNLAHWAAMNIVTLDDTVTLDANGAPGDTITITHNFNFPPGVAAFRWTGAAWADATGTYDALHAADGNSVSITNTTAGALTFLIRLL